MKRNRKTKAGLRMLVLLAFLGIQGPAMAMDISGLYFGGNFGRARNEYDTGMADADLQEAAAAASDSLSISARSTSRLSHVWWGDVGYYLTPNLAIEVEYLHLGGMTYLSAGTLTVNGTDSSIFTGQELTSRGPAVSVVGRLPVTQWFEMHAMLGDYVGKALLQEDLATGGFTSSTTSSNTTSSLLAGAGVAFNFGGHLSARADFLRVNKTGGGDIGKFSVNMITGGISYTF